MGRGKHFVVTLVMLFSILGCKDDVASQRERAVEEREQMVEEAHKQNTEQVRSQLNGQVSNLEAMTDTALQPGANEKPQESILSLDEIRVR